MSGDARRRNVVGERGARLADEPEETEMLPYSTVAALAADRQSRLLIEAQRDRLAAGVARQHAHGAHPVATRRPLRRVVEAGSAAFAAAWNRLSKGTSRATAGARVVSPPNPAPGRP